MCYRKVLYVLIFMKFTWYMYLFFFSSRRRHTRSLCDWSSDVCSSDLDHPGIHRQREVGRRRADGGDGVGHVSLGGRSARNDRFGSQHGGRRIVSARHPEWRIEARSFGREFAWRCRVMPGYKPLPLSFTRPSADQARRAESRRRGGDPEAAGRLLEDALEASV